MNHIIEPKSTCTKCNTQVNQKRLRPEHLDVSTQSLLLMFRLNEVTMVECPRCGSRRMLV